MANLSRDVSDALMKIAKPKFNDFLALTAASSKPRSVPDPDGKPWFIYPDATVNTDITFLWAVLSDVYQTIGGPEPFAQFIRAESYLLLQMESIVDGESNGSFWRFPTGRIPLQDAVGGSLAQVLGTLRNGFAHSHWFHANLSAEDYWKALGWDVSGNDMGFGLRSRPPLNYMMYIADANVKVWKPEAFWSMNDLRILVTPSHVLRYRFHRLLNYVLNGSKLDIFGNP